MIRQLGIVVDGSSAGPGEQQFVVLAKTASMSAGGVSENPTHNFSIRNREFELIVNGRTQVYNHGGNTYARQFDMVVPKRYHFCLWGGCKTLDSNKRADDKDGVAEWSIGE